MFPVHGHLGSSLGAVNADGRSLEQIDSDAFGIGAEDTAQSYSFAGEYWDRESQLLYLRARWYDPRIGRFVSADPLEGENSEPRTLNRYVYAASDPVHNVDPTGEMTAGDTGMAANVQGTLSTIGQQSLQTQIRKIMLGDPKRGDFGIIGDLILDQMLGAVEDVLTDKKLAKKSAQAKGSHAHKLLEERIRSLNQWIKGIPLARDIDVQAELFLDSNGQKVSRGTKGGMGLDVVIMYRGKKFAAFDLKMGSSTISNTKYFEYQRRFKTRVFLVRFK